MVQLISQSFYPTPLLTLILSCSQQEATCRRLESVFRNQSHNVFKENELRQLTEKFIALTNHADAALQKLEAHLANDPEDSDVTAEANKLMLKLNAFR